MDTLLELLHIGGTSAEAGYLGAIGSWGYLILFLLVVVEGPFATLFGGAAVATGILQPIPVFVTASAANVVGDTLWYLLGYSGSVGGMRFLQRVGIRASQIQRMQKRMHRQPTRLLLTAKFSGLTIPAMVAVGLSRVPWRRWFATVVTAECLWAGALVLVGLYLTDFITEVNQALRVIMLGLLCVVVMLMVRMYRNAEAGEEELLQAEEDEATVITAG